MVPQAAAPVWDEQDADLLRELQQLVVPGEAVVLWWESWLSGGPLLSGVGEIVTSEGVVASERAAERAGSTAAAALRRELEAMARTYGTYRQPARSHPYWTPEYGHTDFGL
jgi:hypothetical protein